MMQKMASVICGCVLTVWAPVPLINPKPVLFSVREVRKVPVPALKTHGAQANKIPHETAFNEMWWYLIQGICWHPVVEKKTLIQWKTSKYFMRALCTSAFLHILWPSQAVREVQMAHSQSHRPDSRPHSDGWVNTIWLQQQQQGPEVPEPAVHRHTSLVVRKVNTETAIN